MITGVFYKENSRENSAQLRTEANTTCIWAFNSTSLKKMNSFHYRCHWSLHTGPECENCLLHPGKTTIVKSEKILWEINQNTFLPRDSLPVTTQRTAGSSRAKTGSDSIQHSVLSPDWCLTLANLEAKRWLTVSRCWVESRDDAWDNVLDLVCCWIRPNWSNSCSEKLASVFC